jgi:hypothetical protein
LTSQNLQNRSGTRLRARFARGSDGSQYLIGWFDTKLNVRCAPSTLSFGAMGGTLDPGKPYACRPSYPSVDHQTTLSAYSDAACTKAILLSLQNTVPARAYGGGLYDFKKTNATPPSTVYSKDTAGACVSSAVNLPAGTAVYVYEANPVSDSEFVTFTADP